MRLIYLPTAIADIVRLRDFLEPKDPRAAVNVALRLYGAAESLVSAPDRGTSIAGTPYRKLVIRMRRSAYIMRYRVDRERDAVVIVRIWHGREVQK